MRNDEKTLTDKILSAVEGLPIFSFNNLRLIDVPPYQLRIALNRLKKRGRIIGLKKGFYTSARFIERAKSDRTWTPFVEFIATKLYFPSYLSLEYVLYENNILTEVPVNFTLITKNKTYAITNNIGVFIYHKIKDSLYCGYRVEKANGYFYFKADKAKALFDFLYLRKKMIINRETAYALRLNLEVFTKADLRSLRQYVEIEGSNKMREIFSFLF
ncbi:MAG: type IV toxin-antitoxin system AbiEi family antitoxin domain-containing protein [bacterium]